MAPSQMESSNALYPPLKILSLVVLAAMVAAMLYSGYTSIAYWDGIGV